MSSFLTPAKGSGINWNSSQYNAPITASGGFKLANPTVADSFSQDITNKTDNHKQVEKTHETDGNGFPNCLGGFYALVCSKPSKQLGNLFLSVSCIF